MSLFFGHFSKKKTLTDFFCPSLFPNQCTLCTGRPFLSDFLSEIPDSAELFKKSYSSSMGMLPESVKKMVTKEAR